MRIIFTYIALIAFLGLSHASEQSKASKTKDTAKTFRIVYPINKSISVSAPISIKPKSTLNLNSKNGRTMAMQEEIDTLKKKNIALIKENTILNRRKQYFDPKKSNYDELIRMANRKIKRNQSNIKATMLEIQSKERLLHDIENEPDDNAI